MTDAIYIEEDVENLAFSHTFAVIDLSHFGQRSCKPCSIKGQLLAEEIAKVFTDALNESGFDIAPEFWKSIGM